MTGFKGERSPAERTSAVNRLRRRHRRLLASLPREAKVLELGCGAGEFIELLGQLGFSKALGVDVSEQQVAIGRSLGLQIERANAMDYLAEHTDEFDYIFAFDFLEHLSKVELVSLLNSIRTALRPDGTVIAQTPNGAGLLAGQVIYGDFTHLTILTAGSAGQLFRACGFPSVQVTEVSQGRPGSLKALLRLIVWRAASFFASVVKLAETGKWHTYWTENIQIVATVRPNSQGPAEKVAP